MFFQFPSQLVFLKLLFEQKKKVIIGKELYEKVEVQGINVIKIKRG